ncbi:MAG: SUMF1/EgtB/PvdO family nonheme iron enzyme [Anaerolineaceae bacterium]|nr:SUMF1/EgtB/PvdO family nonheme iron enzyme [Anaerolineaceae bacterium]
MTPSYWANKIWNVEDYPVVGISWYEAMAFCTWLSVVSGEHILLPTTQQWQRAAQASPNGSTVVICTHGKPVGRDAV